MYGIQIVLMTRAIFEFEFTEQEAICHSNAVTVVMAVTSILQLQSDIPVPTHVL
jgi:hypothetical protein